MNESPKSLTGSSALQAIAEAATAGRISESAVTNLKIWISDNRYARYVAGILQHVADGKWKELDDVFWTVIPFGTGGRRGMMYPFGSNAINERTIGESAQGLATYVRKTRPGGPWSCGIAYDTRHRSREFAELCAGVLVANGFTVFFIDDYRSTPELSFLVRYRKCDCGIMVTASHNPPSDNAVKVYWSSGAQLIPPHDKAVIQEVMQVGDFPVAGFDDSVRAGKIILCKEEIDQALLNEQLKQSHSGPRDLDIIYSPLHGVGEFNVASLLKAAGFRKLAIYGPHRQPDGDFPNVPGNVSNPENPEVFTAIVEQARRDRAHLILATDPDCDRMGAAAPLTMDPSGEWSTFDGNQLGALLADFVLARRKASGKAGPGDYVVTTLVTTQMIRRIAESYGATCFFNNLVGFKWICSVIDREGPEGFLFGTEESHGYLAGTHARDKDGAIACLLMAELAAECRSNRISVHEKLDQLYVKHGFHRERLATIRMEGSDGMRRMQLLMDQLRLKGPAAIGGLPVTTVRDYLKSEIHVAGGSKSALDGPVDNLIILDTEIEGNYVAVRPSGTEPKVKMYMFTYQAPRLIRDLSATRIEMNQRLDAFARDIEAFAETV
jgi:phosphomannomutase